MDQSNNQNFDNGGQMQLPNTTLALILAIVSIVACCCFGPAGLIMAIIGLVLANKDINLYMQDSGSYSLKSYKNAKTAKTISIIGLVLGILGSLSVIYQLVTTGSLIMDSDELQRILEEYQQ